MTVCVLVLVVMIAPKNLSAQCESLTAETKPQNSKPSSALGKPEYFDEPAFTVAGVADTTNGGGHASGMAQPRTTEALAKRIPSLGKESNPGEGAATSGSAAEKSLRDTVNNGPRNFEANRRLGEWLTDQGRGQEAISYLQRANELNPQDDETAYELAKAYAQAGDYERSRATAEGLLALQSRPEKGGKSPAEVHHLLGEVQEKLGNSLASVHEYQRAAELEPSEPNLFDWGAELLLHGALEPAIEVFGKGNRLFPGSVRMLVGLGVAWYSRGSYQEAATRLCTATDANPSDPSPYPFLSNTVNAESPMVEGIVERLARFARLRPDTAQANYYYAIGLWKQRKGPLDRENLEQIRSLLEKAVRLDPMLGAAHLQLGTLYAEQGDMAKAIFAYQNAIAATPQLPEAHYRLAQAYRQAKETAKAQQELETFQRVTKETAEEAEREKREVRQFVYTMQSSTPRQ